MHVALFNGFPFHFEMFGFAIEYLKSRAIPFTIFTEGHGEMGWLAFYREQFGPLDIQHYSRYYSSKCDVVFLLTDDDPRFALTGGPQPTILLFEHRATRISWPQVENRFSLRPIEGRDPDSWMLPVWSPTIPKQKKERIHIVVIGYNCPTTPDSLTPYISNLSDIEWTFITRVAHHEVILEDTWKPYSPRILYGVDATTMMKETAMADWLLVIPKQDYQVRDAISAMVPLAYALGIPMLMRAEDKATYPVQGIQALDPKQPLTKPSASLLAEVAEEKERLLNRRDRLLDAILLQR